MPRDVVTIDETKCDGCGECVTACHEGAIRIVSGKARLVADALCDGLGACLGYCPRGAITVERREAPPFDEAAVAAHLAASREAGATHPRPREPLVVLGAAPSAPESDAAPACPSARFSSFGPGPRFAPAGNALPPAGRSELTHWPVQLGLLPPTAPVLRGASLLLAADCVPVAFPGFHQQLLRGRAVVIGCPKFDDVRGYVEKLARMIAESALRDITVARMEVPCCGGLVMAVLEARRRSGRDFPVTEVVVGTRGDLLARRDLPID
ncbi:MAG: 4Fe-4S binding protein [Acidobacteriia bacterium]|nr:4Fe-4S binding protein [Terriglobia bacterium]